MDQGAGEADQNLLEPVRAYGTIGGDVVVLDRVRVAPSPQQGRRRVLDQLAELTPILGRQPQRRRAVQRKHAEEAPLAQDRKAQEARESVIPPPVAAEETRIGKDVV